MWKGAGCFAANAGLLLSIFLIAVLACTVVAAQGPGLRAGAPSIIDTHNHLFGRFPAGPGPVVVDYDGAAQVALETMDKLGIKTLIVMPPPFAPSHPHPYDAEDLLDVVRSRPDRFAFLAGGGSLNPMLHQAARDGKAGPDVRRLFEQKALEILSKGALGFGEMTAEHFSLGGPTHPYESVPPDHPLFLLLADIAARHDVPIDIHMEAVPEEMPLPQRLSSPPNPRILRPNTAAFERLLAHNRNAKIIWAHAGWDNTGRRTAKLSAELLGRHSNLYMSLKVGRDSGPENRPVERERGIRPEWLDLIRAFPDRFLIGSDQFYLSPRAPQRFPRHPEATTGILTGLPPDLARKVAYENARRLFKLRD
jgi:predicted TIM-barrel fold metal-dependent hydrolase